MVAMTGTVSGLSPHLQPVADQLAAGGWWAGVFRHPEGGDKWLACRAPEEPDCMVDLGLLALVGDPCDFMRRELAAFRERDLPLRPARRARKANAPLPG